MALADAHDEAFLVTRVADSDGLEPSDLLQAMQLKLGQTKQWVVPNLEIIYQSKVSNLPIHCLSG